MSINIILQARTSSSRLPNKVLKPILGKPMLEHQLLRLKQLQGINKIVVATSDEASDNDIEKLCQKSFVACFRGSLNNVLDRYYQTYKKHPSEHIIRITGDCPVIDIKIIKNVIDLHLKTHADYTSNCSPSTLPDGLDVEIFTEKALTDSWVSAKKASEKEHVTLYMRSHPEIFNCQNYFHPIDYSHLRWTVDEPEDFKFINHIFESLYPQNQFFDLAEILELIHQKPELTHINNQFTRNEGLLKSQHADNDIVNTKKE